MHAAARKPARMHAYVMRKGVTVLPLPLHTARLTVRQSIRGDMRNWSALYRSPVVRRHMNGPLQRTAKEWWIGCERNAGLAEQQLSVVLSSSNDFVGVCGLLQSPENREWELYLVLRQKYWRKGLATELSKTLITIAFDSLGARRVVGIIDPENQSSLKMVEKLGFRFMRKHSKPGHWQDGHFFYGIENKNA